MSKSANASLVAKEQNEENLNVVDHDEFDNLLLDQDNENEDSNLDFNPNEEFKIRVDTPNADKLLYLLVELMNKCTQDVKNVIKPKIKSDISLPTSVNSPNNLFDLQNSSSKENEKNNKKDKKKKKQENNLNNDLNNNKQSLYQINYQYKRFLKKRAIFLAHYDNVSNQGSANLDSADYFKLKWDGGNVLTLGKEFHPTVFGGAFGKAVGWESTLNTVVFRSATFSEFSKFINSLVQYSETIDKIVFLDYSREKKLAFNLLTTNLLIKQNDSSSNSNSDSDSNKGKKKNEHYYKNDCFVKKWWFLNTSSNVIVPFLSASDQLPQPFDELVIGRYSFSEEDATSIFNHMSSSLVVNNINILKLITVKFNVFPCPIFIQTVSKFQCLQTLYIKEINFDGNKLLSALCISNPRIHQISLIKMRFEDNFPSNLKVPQGLIILDVSKSQFINLAFASFLAGITSVKSDIPFIFIGRKLKVYDEEFELMKNLSFRECQPNFLEFNFSHNNIPVIEGTTFFDFLCTQTRMKQVVFNDITTDDPAKLINNIIQLCITTGVQGLDIGVHFEQTIIQMFISLLATCKNLTRLSIKNCGAGNEGLVTLCSLFKLLENLKEFACDGFRPRPMNEEELDARKSGLHPLVELWMKIGQSKHIERNDWPSQDLAMSQVIFDETRRRDQLWINALKNRKPPKTQQERIQTILDGLRQQEEGWRQEEFNKMKHGVSHISESDDSENGFEEEETSKTESSDQSSSESPVESKQKIKSKKDDESDESYS